MDKKRCCLVEVYSPEIINNLFLEGLLIGDQCRIKGSAAFKGILLEHPPAKSVDGKYGGLVIGMALLLCQFFKKRVFGPASGESLYSLPQLISDPVLQFPGRRFRKGHDEDLADGQTSFQHQPEKESCNGVCLSRPGARFDQVGPFEGTVQEIKLCAIPHFTNSD